MRPISSPSTIVRMAGMHIDIDPINKLLYVRIKDGSVHKTLRFLDGEVMVDVSKSGRIIGIEFLDFKVPRKLLNDLARQFRTPAIKKIHPEEAAKVFA